MIWKIWRCVTVVFLFISSSRLFRVGLKSSAKFYSFRLSLITCSPFVDMKLPRKIKLLTEKEWDLYRQGFLFFTWLECYVIAWFFMIQLLTFLKFINLIIVDFDIEFLEIVYILLSLLMTDRTRMSEKHCGKYL